MLQVDRDIENALVVQLLRLQTATNPADRRTAYQEMLKIMCRRSKHRLHQMEMDNMNRAMNEPAHKS